MVRLNISLTINYMNILISGNNGYIGGRLVEYLLRFEDFKLFLSSRKILTKKIIYVFLKLIGKILRMF